MKDEAIKNALEVLRGKRGDRIVSRRRFYVDWFLVKMAIGFAGLMCWWYYICEHVIVIH